jgi:hypothetical protein
VKNSFCPCRDSNPRSSSQGFSNKCRSCKTYWSTCTSYPGSVLSPLWRKTNITASGSNSAAQCTVLSPANLSRFYSSTRRMSALRTYRHIHTVTRNTYFYREHSSQRALMFSHFPLSQSMEGTDSTITAGLSFPEVQHVKSLYPCPCPVAQCKGIKMTYWGGGGGLLWTADIDYTGCHWAIFTRIRKKGGGRKGGARRYWVRTEGETWSSHKAFFLLRTEHLITKRKESYKYSLLTNKSSFTTKGKYTGFGYLSTLNKLS